jgi:hypothetical protein
LDCKLAFEVRQELCPALTLRCRLFRGVCARRCIAWLALGARTDDPGTDVIVPACLHKAASTRSLILYIDATNSTLNFNFDNHFSPTTYNCTSLWRPSPTPLRRLRRLSPTSSTVHLPRTPRQHTTRQAGRSRSLVSRVRALPVSLLTKATQVREHDSV